MLAEWTFGQVMWSMLIFFCWILWFWFLFTVFGDVFRRHDISGWVKTAWCIFVVFLPFLGDGERDDPGARAALLGLSDRHTRAAVAFAVLEGIALGVCEAPCFPATSRVLNRSLSLSVRPASTCQPPGSS